MNWPSGIDRVVLDQTDSTMAEAARRAPQLERPVWIMARHQTSARGRRGRIWNARSSSCSATYIFKPGCTPAEAALRSFVAAIAVHSALGHYVVPSRLALKWPNDVLLDGGKVAGILLESAGRSDCVDWLAIGIGVNLGEPPELDNAAFRPVGLGLDIDPEVFLTTLAAHFAGEEKRFTTDGFGPIRTTWLQRAARLGEEIIARTTREEINGVFETIDGDGQLVLQTPKGQVRVPAADIYF